MLQVLKSVNFMFILLYLFILGSVYHFAIQRLSTAKNRELLFDTCLKEYETNTALQNTVQSALRILGKFIPSSFLNDFTCPCWYSRVDGNLSNLLHPQFNRVLTGKFYSSYSPEERERIIGLAVTGPSSGQEKLFCLPKVFVAGFAKCGTTAFYDIVTRHPSINVPYSKEIHFWRTFFQGNVEQEQILSVLHYLFYFTPAISGIMNDPGTLTLDASTSTLINPTIRATSGLKICEIPLVLSKLLPDSKFIVIMRNPVERLWSDYWFFCSWPADGIPNEHLENGPSIFHNHAMNVISAFEKCTGNHSKPILDCYMQVMNGIVSEDGCKCCRVGVGLYYYHIITWLSVFPKEQFLFLRTEDLKRETVSTMNAVWDFLELERPKHDYISQVPILSQSEYKWLTSVQLQNTLRMLPSTKSALEDFYKPFNEKLANLLQDERFLWRDADENYT